MLITVKIKVKYLEMKKEICTHVTYMCIYRIHISKCK